MSHKPILAPPSHELHSANETKAEPCVSLRVLSADMLLGSAGLLQVRNVETSLRNPGTSVGDINPALP